LRQPLCRGALGNSFGKQLWGTALGSSFGKLSGTTFRNNCFEEQQLWGAALGSSFRGFVDQLSVATFGGSFREPLCRLALGSRFGVYGIGLKNRSFGAIALDSSFGEELLAATLGRSFRQPLCRMALGSRFGEEVCRIAESQLWGNSFGQLSGPALR